MNSIVRFVIRMCWRAPNIADSATDAPQVLIIIAGIWITVSVNKTMISFSN